MAGNPQWQETTDRLSALMKDLTSYNVNTGIPAELDQILKSAVNDSAQWPNDRRVYTFGQLDPDKCILLCRAGHLPWWMPLTGRVVRGELEEMKKLHAGYSKDMGQGQKLDFSPMLSWVMNPTEIAPGTPTKRSPEVIRQLLKWGGDPNYAEGKWLDYALRKHEADCIKPLLEHGAASSTVQRVMDALQREQNYTQLGRVQEALARTSHIKIDAETVMEAKYIPDAKGTSVFKTLFNFRSRRVHEIYESGQGAQATMQGIPFGEYDLDALADARERLIRLGGTPREIDGVLEKRKALKPALRPENG